jgi:acyl phosphate:glycerol-3-phosphate acyltransferase
MPKRGVRSCRESGCSSAWLERCVRDAEVAGSNPVTPTIRTVIALLIIAGYLFGSIPVGLIVGRCRGFDPRTVGSGNIGTTNVARAGGEGPAAITFAGDLLKGLVPVLIARAIVGPVPQLLALVGLAALIGAISSIFLKFAGGRGVATSLGVWLELAPAPVAVAILAFIVILALARIVSLASMGAAMTLPVTVAVFGCPRPYILVAIIMSALVLARHHENIRRLLRGEEPVIGRAKQSKVG